MRAHRGMTLIELLVVLLIMGLLVSVTVLSTGISGRGSNSDEEMALTVAEDLSRLFEHASQQALAKNEVLGWGLQNEQDMRWWRWTSLPPAETTLPSTASGRTPVWLPVDESEMKELLLPVDTVLQVLLPDANDLQPDSRPDVVFFPARERSDFEIHIGERDNTRALARVWSVGDGVIRWGAL